MSVDAVMVGPDPQVKDSGGIVADTREKRLLGQYSARRFYFCINIAMRQRADHNILCSLGWSWSGWLEWCEREILLAGWWLEAGARVM